MLSVCHHTSASCFTFLLHVYACMSGSDQVPIITRALVLGHVASFCVRRGMFGMLGEGADEEWATAPAFRDLYSSMLVPDKRFFTPPK